MGRVHPNFLIQRWLDKRGGYAIRLTTGNWRNEDFHLARFSALSAAPYLCESFPGCRGPCHGGSAEFICLFLPPRHRPSPVHYRGRLPACPRRNDFMTDPFFETAAISLCSGPQVCSPPRSFLPLRLIAAGQPRFLRPSKTCFVASACIGYANHPPRQLVVWGLTPHKIHSLVGCSSVKAIFRQLSRQGSLTDNGSGTRAMLGAERTSLG